MFLRRDRVNLHGKTNLEYNSTQIIRPEWQPRIDFLSTAKSSKFDQILKSKMTSTVLLNPIDTQKQYYQEHKQEDFFQRDAHNLQRPRFAHLEELERRKPVWVGDSQLIHKYKIDSELRKQKTMLSISQKKIETDTKDSLVLQKHDTNTRATQETQLVGMEEYSRQTLNGKVDLEKVREVRRAIRRKYGNRKNFQKIFRNWDEDSKGAISVKNVLSMMKRFGINMNFNEARVLIASADKSQSGNLALDEFMELIFNDNDAMNVNLHNLEVLSEKQQDALLEGHDDALIEYLQEDAKQTRVKRHQNQVNLVLKNKIQNVVSQCQATDILNLGYINFEKLDGLIKRLNIPDKIITEDDIKKIYNDFKFDEHTFDYKKFIVHLKDFQLNVLDLYGGTQADLKREKPYEPATSQFNLLKNTQEDERLHVIDCDRANICQLEQIRGKATKMFYTIQRYLPTRKEFDELVLGQFKSKTITVAELNKALTTFLHTVGEKPDKKDVESILSIMQYNNKNISTKDIGQFVYEEDDMAFYERCSMRINGPAPQKDDMKRSEYDTLPLIESEQLKETFYNRKLGLQSSAGNINPGMVTILKKIEDNTFLGSAQQYETFRSYDKDKDGFVSLEDFVVHVKQMNVLNPKEIGHLVNYVDPELKGSLTFQEFSAKIFPGMTTCDHTGQQLVVPHLYPAKERTENKKNHLNDLKRIKSDQNFSQGYERATRFGSTPIHKNTFYNIQQPPTNSALFQSEEQRFTKNPESRTQFQSDEQTRYNKVYSNKLENIRNHQNSIIKKIEDNFQSNLQKDQANRAIKGLATFNYEQRAHLKNDWL